MKDMRKDMQKIGKGMDKPMKKKMGEMKKPMMMTDMQAKRMHDMACKM